MSHADVCRFFRNKADLADAVTLTGNYTGNLASYYHYDPAGAFDNPISFARDGERIAIGA